MRRDYEEDLIGDRSRAREGTDDLDALAMALLPLTLKLGKDPLVDDLAEDAEAVKDDRPRRPTFLRHRRPGPDRVREQAEARRHQGQAARPALEDSALQEHERR